MNNRYFEFLTRTSPLYIPLSIAGYGLVFENDIAMFYAMLLYVSDIFNSILKNILFRQILCPLLTDPSVPYENILGFRCTRPPGARFCGIVPPDLYSTPPSSTSFGMPSGHAQFAIFFFSFWMMYVWKYGRFDTPLKRLRSYFTLVILACCGTAICYSRVANGCHTIAQVVVGGGIGAGMAWLLFRYAQTFDLRRYGIF